MIYCPLWKPGDHYGWHMMAHGLTDHLWSVREMLERIAE